MSVKPPAPEGLPGAGLSVPDRQKISASTKAQASVARWRAARQLQILRITGSLVTFGVEVENRVYLRKICEKILIGLLNKIT